MNLLEDVPLTDSIEIMATPEKVFMYFLQIVDGKNGQAWHPEDHLSFRGVRGEPWQRGSVAYAEEYIHGKLHKLKFPIIEVVPNRKIEFVPLSRFLRILFSQEHVLDRTQRAFMRVRCDGPTSYRKTGQDSCEKEV
jgi:hypothetical protein